MNNLATGVLKQVVIEFQCMNNSLEYSVKWGNIARTIIYKDIEGELLFTTDASIKGNKSITLEHHSPQAVRGLNYNIAFERTKKYLESCGFDVDVYGK